MGASPPAGWALAVVPPLGPARIAELPSARIARLVVVKCVAVNMLFHPF